jgi:hypothetical protein
MSLTKTVVWFMISACLYLNLELSLCQLYCNGYVLYPFIRLNHSCTQRNDRKIFHLIMQTLLEVNRWNVTTVHMVFTTTYTQKWYEVLTTAFLKLQSPGIWCPRRLEASAYTILFQTQQNPRHIHKLETEKGLYTRPRTDRLQTLWWIQL